MIEYEPESYLTAKNYKWYEKKVLEPSLKKTSTILSIKELLSKKAGSHKRSIATYKGSGIFKISSNSQYFS